jgi:pyruvate-formate lyase-activating enzyme
VENRWQEHAEFLQRCHQASVEVFVKVIISSLTESAELERSAKLVADVSPEIPVFLQPVTPLDSSHSQAPVIAPSSDQVLAWQAQMKQSF